MSSKAPSEEQFADYIDASVGAVSPPDADPLQPRQNPRDARCLVRTQIDFCSVSSLDPPQRRVLRFTAATATFAFGLDCGGDKPDSDVEYGLADYDAYRVEECEWLQPPSGRMSSVRLSARSSMPHVPRRRGRGTGTSIQRAFHAGAERGGHRPDALRPRPSIRSTSPKGRGSRIVINDNKIHPLRRAFDGLIRVQIVGSPAKPRRPLHTHEFPLPNRE